MKRALYIALALVVVLVIGVFMLPSRMQRALTLMVNDPEVELLMTADRRPDIERTDRWRLKMRESFVVTRFPTVGNSGGAYRLELLLGHDRAPTVIDRDTDNIDLAIGGFFRRPPDERAQDEAQRIERGCRKVKDAQSGDGSWGLTRYEVPRDSVAGVYCAYKGFDYSVFAAGSAPGRYEVVIDCKHKAGTTEEPPALDKCDVQAFSIEGWVAAVRFDAHRLPRWREIVSRSVAFLKAHTIENTLGLPSTEIGWVTAPAR